MGCELYKMSCWRPRTGCILPSLSFRWLGMSCLRLRASCGGSREELLAARDELCNKTALLDEARRKASEAISFEERLTEECRGLRGNLHRQEALVV